VWQEPLAAADAARGQLAQLPGFSLLQDGSCGCQESVLGFDPCRLVLNVASLGVSGFAAAAWLEEQHGIVPELATNKVGTWHGAQKVVASRASACTLLVGICTGRHEAA
jgi:arginine/lysine/ornithine decarboxylase